jgi:molybdate transport system ATP-binding protein
MTLELHGTVQRGEFHRDVSISAQPGQVTAILGVNGSGKSTVLHTIAGLSPLRTGLLTVDDVTWDAPAESRWITPEQRHCAVVFQDLRLFPHLDVLRNITFGLRASGIRRVAAVARAHEALAEVGASPLANRKPANLSGGERQRVALARALVMKPRVLLLDEPFASVDEESHRAFRELLPRIVEGLNAITLMVTHDETDASAIASRQVRLSPQELP